MNASLVQTRINPPVRDLGDGFSVRRALPVMQCRSVGPFVFFDAFGPTALAPATGLDVRPHPHIGLATVTYLFEGEVMHRDSLGSVQPIVPGEVNWMTAGRGIVHSERTPAALRGGGARLAGIQLWVALPLAHEQAEPAFAHYAALPLVRHDGATIRLILGDGWGERSPVRTLSPMFYAAIELADGARATLAADPAERAVYVFEGAVTLGNESVRAGELVVLRAGAEAPIDAAGAARVLAIGGPPLDAPRFVWWNFVSSRAERIREAAAQWKAGRFAGVPGDSEFIPLPDRGPGGVVDYP
jgi:redox-sensitive bicupin YhaK (pirin superfamily)